MNFMLRGLIQINTEGKSIALVTLAQEPRLPDLRGPALRHSGAGRSGPCCSSWSARCIYNRHRFGVHVHIVGDNPDAAQQMGINVKLVRLKTFVFVGLGAALAGVFAVISTTPGGRRPGDGYLLPALASVFVGGTAPWGGIGTDRRQRHRQLHRVVHPDRASSASDCRASTCSSSTA